MSQHDKSAAPRAFATRVIHAGQSPDPTTGALMPPIYANSTYLQESPGVHKGFDYGRSHNPTRFALERCVADLEGGTQAFAFASGLAAISTVLELLDAGAHVVSGNDLYGGTFRLFDKVRQRSAGHRFSYVDLTDLNAFEAALQDNTRMVWVETPSNPLLSLTDLAAIARICRDRGIICVAGVEVGSRTIQGLRRQMQPVFQDPSAALDPRMRILDIVTEPLMIHRRESGVPSGKAALRVAASELMASVGLDDSALARFPHEFSGGQRQRINIARALALKPQFVVLDEPVSALDVSVGAQIVNLLRTLQRDHGLTYLFISHSMPLVRYLSTRIAVIERGRLIETGEAEQLCANPRENYTRQLLAATPELPGL